LPLVPGSFEKPIFPGPRANAGLPEIPDIFCLFHEGVSMFSVNVNKNYVLRMASGLAAISLLSGCGSGGGDQVAAAMAQASAGQTEGAAAASSEALEVHYDFLAKEELRVKPVTMGVLSAEELVIPAGTPLTVLETKLDETHGTLVRLGIKVEEGSKLPSDAWFLLDDTLLLALQTKEAAPAKNEEVAQN
jgi:hypothetical protein